MADFKQITVGGISYPAKDEVARQGLAGKQDKIDSSHKLSADLITDGSTNKTVTQTEKNSWNGKQGAISAQSKLSADLVDDSSATNKFVTSTEKSTWDGKQDALVSGTNIKTVNNQSILGSGNITIQAGDTQIQSDWNQTNSSLKDYIKNKPTNLALIGDTQGSATTANFDPETDTVHLAAQVLSSSTQAQVRTNISAAENAVFGASGSNHSTGLVPDPGSTSGTSKYLREDGTWQTPSGSGEANVIESISINGTTQTVTSKNVDLAVPTSSDVTAIVKMTEAAYALITPDANTLYILTSS